MFMIHMGITEDAERAVNGNTHQTADYYGQ